MGKSVMAGPGKGGPGKTTTMVNMAVALALEFLQQRWFSILQEVLQENGSTARQLKLEKLKKRVVQQLLMQLLINIILTEEQVIHVLARQGICDEDIVKLTLPLVDAQLKHDVLVCEMDSQMDARKTLDVPFPKIKEEQDREKNMHDVLHNPQFGIEYAVRATKFLVDLVPAAVDMSDIENLSSTNDPLKALRREYRLDDALRRAKGTLDYPITQQAIERYRVILIDPPPTLGVMNLQTMTAADLAICIIDMGRFASDALDQFESRLELVQTICDGHTIVLGGVLCNQFSNQKGYVDQCVAAEQSVRTLYGDRVFQTVIPENPRIFDAPTFSRPVQYHEPQSSTTKIAALAYTKCAHEWIERFSL